MLDLKNIFQAMEEPLAKYCEVNGVNNEYEELISPTPRLLYKATPDANLKEKPMLVSKKEVLSTDSRFEYDIEYTYLSYPRVKLTISFEQIENSLLYLAKAQQWFELPQLGRTFFNNYEIVVKKVGDIELIETKATNKTSFTVILQFKEVVKVREKTIESLELTGFDNKKIITKY